MSSYGTCTNCGSQYEHGCLCPECGDAEFITCEQCGERGPEFEHDYRIIDMRVCSEACYSKAVDYANEVEDTYKGLSSWLDRQGNHMGGAGRRS